jgi:hypothetical protein
VALLCAGDVCAPDPSLLVCCACSRRRIAGRVLCFLLLTSCPCCTCTVFAPADVLLLAARVLCLLLPSSCSSLAVLAFQLHAPWLPVHRCQLHTLRLLCLRLPAFVLSTMCFSAPAYCFVPPHSPPPHALCLVDFRRQNVPLHHSFLLYLFVC